MRTGMRLSHHVLTPYPSYARAVKTKTGGNAMKTNGRSLAIALAFAVVLVGGLVYLKDRGSSASPQAGGPPNDYSCLTLKVLASSEREEMVGGVEDDYSKQGEEL